MKYWITKYALTQNIFTIEATVCENTAGSMIQESADGGYRVCYHKPHWHETPELALLRAEEMRGKKIASIKKSIAKIEKIKFIATN